MLEECIIDGFNYSLDCKYSYVIGDSSVTSRAIPDCLQAYVERGGYYITILFDLNTDHDEIKRDVMIAVKRSWKSLTGRIK